MYKRRVNILATKSTPDLKAKFKNKTEMDTKTKCWNWLGCIDKKGYARFQVNTSSVCAHVASWVIFKGCLPKNNMQLHHICNNKACVNPKHLKLVTPRDHYRNLTPRSFAFKNARKSHCPKGHALKEPNLHPWYKKKGRRACLICFRLRDKLIQRKIRAAKRDL